jgi:hypothetical protein
VSPDPFDPIDGALEDRLRRTFAHVATTTVVPDPGQALTGALGWAAAVPLARPLDPPVLHRRAQLAWRVIGAAALLALIVAGAGLLSRGGDGSNPTVETPGATFPSSTTGAATPVTPADPLASPTYLRQDHWHAAYGLFVCDHFLPDQTDIREDALGIHTHGEGLIHIHPFSIASSGTNARMALFAEQVGMTLRDDELGLHDGTVYRNGDRCPNGQPMSLKVYEWKVDDPAAAPRVFSSDFGAIPFTGDRLAFTIAMVPDGVTPRKPPSIPRLDDLTDVPDAAVNPVEGTAPGR